MFNLSPQLLWNYKLNLTTDPKFESVAVEVCKTTITDVSWLASLLYGSDYRSLMLLVSLSLAPSNTQHF